MSDGRREILDKIRTTRGRGALSAGNRHMLDKRLADHPRNLIPARADGPDAELVSQFMDYLGKAGASVFRVQRTSDVPGAVSDFLRENNLPGRVRTTTDPEIDALPWSDEEMLERQIGAAEKTDEASVTSAVAGIAETGTLLLTSGKHNPTSLNFLPENHIVVLPSNSVVGSYEDALDKVRKLGAIPRTINLITGPSRTGDVELVMEMGAHGPRRLHVILVDD